jgi:putative membrane protein
MKTASRLFSEQERQLIAATVAEAEKDTAGEIVPVVATVSGRYDRAEDLFGLLLGLVALAVIWVLFQDTTETAWAAGHTPTLGLAAIIASVVAGFLAGAALATRYPVLRLPFIPPREMRQEVERRALEAFQRYRVRTTVGGTGVLIYVSLYEHMVRVVGDDAVTEKISQADWEAICALVVDGMKTDRAADGLAQAVRKSGELLARHFPIQPGDRNELANELILID